jgi:hypothetical protein
VADEYTYPLYLRFGEPPPSGRSSTGWVAYLAAGGEPPPGGAPLRFGEPGVACFRARRISENEIECDVSAHPLVAEAFLRSSRLDRPAYLLRGRVARTCSAGELALMVEADELLPEDVRLVSSGHHAFRAAAIRFIRSLEGKRGGESVEPAM